jgi:hypothetical protein
MNRHRSLLILIALLTLTACRDAGTPTVSSAPTSSPAAPTAAPQTASPTEHEPVSATPTPTTEAVPSDELGAFTCELPITESATASGITNYTDVRVGTHDGYDRVVIEFNLGTPEFRLEHDEPPHEQPASGFPVDVEGESVLLLTLFNGTAMMESGESSYDGPLNLDPGMPVLVDVVHGADFEAQTAWFIGLARESCIRVTLLTDPDRIVIDVEH